jgi:hypothetical protein
VGENNLVLQSYPTVRVPFTSVRLTQSIYAPPGIQWDRRLVAIDSGSTIYRFAIKGSKGTR